MYYEARYYDAVLGRFTQADTVVPAPGNPQALNRYAYALNNPLRYTDPTGHTICADESCDIVFGPRQRNLIRRGLGASYWGQNGLGMVWDWFTESGPQIRYYGASAPMTKDLMHDEGVQQAREHFYSTGKPDYPYSFTHPKQPIREAVQWATGEDGTGIGSVLGSYAVHIQDNGDGTITIWVENVVSRESATRFLGYAPSVEDTVASGSVVASTEALVEELGKFVSGESTLGRIRKRWPRSVLDSTHRGQPSATGLVPGIWGGNMKTWFMWTEPLRVTCQ